MKDEKKEKKIGQGRKIGTFRWLLASCCVTAMALLGAEQPREKKRKFEHYFKVREGEKFHNLNSQFEYFNAAVAMLREHEFNPVNIQSMNAIEPGHNNKTDDFHGDNWQHCDPKLVTCQIVLEQGSHY